ncbi:hypothetical protein HX799_07580 [Pseudomonas tolaasii]|uniref:hypothetical protein n=1 Tax=Pseudomonas tolaasii TaxID=29442 RepID=UPI0015A0D5C7|nr:hypothetical protein [Pseudomonas tolaasii]NWC26867.1 hypothetical protein [Pseudomonas tolaasii]NWC51020.1 hypothetical protein [Pseudomonas tolaasii]NWE62616.1 hypothetical protein [Pseudomonas tolaasii]
MADSNIDIFDQITGLIFSRLYQSFPVTKTLSSMDFIAAFPNDIERPGVFFADTMKWLIASGYLMGEMDAKLHATFHKCTLTAKGLEVLKAVPDSVTGTTIGAQLQDAAKKGMLDSVKSLTGKALSAGAHMTISTAAAWIANS